MLSCKCSVLSCYGAVHGAHRGAPLCRKHLAETARSLSPASTGPRTPNPLLSLPRQFGRYIIGACPSGCSKWVCLGEAPTLPLRPAPPLVPLSGRVEGVAPDSRRNERLLPHSEPLVQHTGLLHCTPPRVGQRDCQSSGSTSTCTDWINSWDGLSISQPWQGRKSWRSPLTLKRPSCPMTRGASFAPADRGSTRECRR